MNPSRIFTFKTLNLAIQYFLIKLTDKADDLKNERKGRKM